MQKIKITLSFLSLLLLSGCDQSPSSTLQENHKIPPEPVVKQLEMPDWVANYQAFIPCDSCEKRLMSLQLFQDKTYVLKEVKFLKQKTKQKESTGSLSFDPENPNIMQLIDTKTQKKYYFALHAAAIELLDNQKKSLPASDQYQLQKVESIEVNNALKYVDIQADLYTSENVILDSVHYIKLSYFFEIDNHSDTTIKLRASDIVLVDHKYNEYPSLFEDDSLLSIQPHATDYQLVSFLYPEIDSPAYINIK